VRKPPDIRVFPAGDGWARGAAESLSLILHEAIEKKGDALIALSAGSTPAPVFDLLARGGQLPAVDWSRVHIAFADERAVSPDDPESNYGMIRRRLIGPAGIPEAHILRILGEEHPAIAAEKYMAALRSHAGREMPRLDCVVLGVGEDGHTASLFPGTEVLHEAVLPVRAVFVPRLASWRVTLTFPCINSAEHVVFLASGGSKGPVVAKVLEDPPDILLHPATGVNPARTHVQWVLDTGAAALLSPPGPFAAGGIRARD
jgi:6-phosphogluconolactonase